MTGSVTVELDAQYRQLREECGLLDRSERGKLLLSGGEAAEYLQGQLTNDIEALEPGEGCYAALLDRKGHMQADMRVLRVAPEEIWLDTEAEAMAATLGHLQMYKIGRQVEIEEVTETRAILSLLGPRSADLAGSAPLPPYANKSIALNGVECIAVGTAIGIDLIAATPDAGELRTILAAAGAPEVSADAVEILRIESGTPRFGSEMDSGTMPAEAGIVATAVNFEKGCYIGQETVARLHYRGKPNRHLRGLRLSASAEPGAALMLGEKQVGLLGSSCVSPVFGPIALAILRREAEPGTELAVGEDGVTARVVDLPFG
ncbi:MAG TPA: glycine cleavage T C-terminal barrel domain-containing protein [Solirubrobacterales bacterium]|nr:glycine cleavage T C-terminal barrel domain-containing protein [Solirubrobacterales bacterium]